MESITDSKYIVFHRDEFTRALTGSNLHIEAIQIPDAVVIRRQDLFASPALATYASMISIAAHLTEDETKRKDLLRISDYFEQQAQHAADEGHKLPD